VVLAAVGAVVIDGPQPAGALVVLMPLLSLAPLTVVMLRHNAEVKRRDTEAARGADGERE
jgi:hypothetical protein